MASRGAYFFCAEGDMEQAVTLIEKSVELNYHRAGLLEKDQLKVFDSLLNTNLGLTQANDTNHCVGYIVVKRNDKIEVREVPQRAGGIKYSVDQKENPNSIYFRPCGLYVQGKAIIQGNVSTISTEPTSVELFNIFKKCLKQFCVTAKGELVGKAALELYKKGWRLTQSLRSPTEYDFRIEHK